MPIDIDKFKGRGSDKDGATKAWSDPITGKKAKPTGGSASDGAAVTIEKNVDRAAARNTDSSTDT